MVLFALPIGILGFVICFALVMMCVPLGLFTTIQTLWAWSKIGNGRKTMVTLLILLLWWTLPLLAGLLLGWSWFLVVVLLETATWVAPPVLIFLGAYWGIRACTAFRKEERVKPQATDDIKLAETALVVMVACVSSCTAGWALFFLTLVKSPVVFVCTMYHGSLYVLRWIYNMREQFGGWVVLALIGFGVAFWIAIPCVGFAIALSVLIEVTVVTLWPPFVAHCGFDTDRGKKRRDISTASAYEEAAKAAYLVLVTADILTNSVIRQEPELAAQAAYEARDVATGKRSGLSPASWRMSLLPPLVIGSAVGSQEGAEHEAQGAAAVAAARSAAAATAGSWKNMFARFKSS